MRITGRLLLAIFVLAHLGCATGPAATSEPPADVSGAWSGTLTVSPMSFIRCCGGQSGEAHVDLEQDGDKVTGSLKAPGIKGTITAWVKGTTLSGSMSYTAGMSSGSSRFDGTAAGNEMLVTTLDSKLVLSRVR